MIIALDCDEVLAKWRDHAFKYFTQFSDIPYEKYCLTWKIQDLLEENQKSEFMDLLNSSNMIEELEPHKEAIEGVKNLKKLGEVFIVTAPMLKYPKWILHRNKWLNKNFDINEKHVIHTHSKQLISADVFVDDKPENVEEWIKLQTGIAVLWKTEANRNHSLAVKNLTSVRYVNCWNKLVEIVKDYDESYEGELPF